MSVADPEMELEQSGLLKKSEFTIIAGAALVVTGLVCFFFFQYTDSPKKDLEPAPKVDLALEQRIVALEDALVKLKLNNGSGPSGGDVSKALAPMKHKVARVEAAVMLKCDSLADRMARIEKKLDALGQVASRKKADARVVVEKLDVKGASSKKGVPSKKIEFKAPSQGTQSKDRVAKAAAPVKKPLVPKRKPVLHTVQKGETLWRISKKYKVSVARLRTLNSLSANDSIHVGTRLIIR